jgi:hypothetical protein
MQAIKGEDKVCEECDRKHKREIPQNNLKAEECQESYLKVAECMNLRNGQINQCKDEWDAFRKCHDGFDAK